jgi:predicted Zn-dependent protease
MKTASDLRRVSAGIGIAAALALLLAGVGCKNTNFLSTRDEVRIGRQASEEIDKEYRVETDTKDAARVRRIGERLLPHAEQRRDVPYTFKVIDAPVVNAVSLPGGPVYVYRGLLDLAGSDDDAVACVIAHEIGHINARHAAKMISQQLAANIGIAILVRGRDLQNLAGLASDLINLSYSRDDEYEADRRGLSYAHKAGYDPRGMIRFFKLLQTMEKKGGGGPEFLRTHPLTKARIDRAERIIETQDYPYGQ